MKPHATPTQSLMRRVLYGGTIAFAMASSAAHAFIDERTPPPPPPLPPEAQPTPPTPLMAPVPSGSGAPSLPAVASSLTGTFGEIAWAAPLAGAIDTHGGMPLSMAIMQTVPSVIGTVQLDGDASTFARMVKIPSGTSYQRALESIAQQAGVRVERYRKTFRVVDLASGGQPAVAALAVAPPPPPKPAFAVTVEDGNVRRTLDRWAETAGWTFSPEHWAVRVDIPLTGSATFTPDFKNSVQALLSSTELGDTPVHGCFYSNHVLRVVPLTERCDRTTAR